MPNEAVKTTASSRSVYACAIVITDGPVESSWRNRHGAIVMPTEPAEAKNQLRGDPYTPRAPGLDANLRSTASIKGSEGCTRSEIEKSPLVPAGSVDFQFGRNRSRRPETSIGRAQQEVGRLRGRLSPCGFPVLRRGRPGVHAKGRIGHCSARLDAPRAWWRDICRSSRGDR